jgi:hypothetical protein
MVYGYYQKYLTANSYGYKNEYIYQLSIYVKVLIDTGQLLCELLRESAYGFAYVVLQRLDA